MCGARLAGRVSGQEDPYGFVGVAVQVSATVGLVAAGEHRLVQGTDKIK